MTRTSPAPTRPVPRPVLRPGVHVMRRGGDELQVGLDPHRAVVLPAREPYTSTLAALSSPGAPSDSRRYDDHVLALLAEAGLLVDVDPLLRLMPPAAPGHGSPGGLLGGDLAALASRVGDDTGVLVQRRSRTVEVAHGGAASASELADQVRAHLARAGCSSPGGGDRSPSTAPVAVGVLVVVGEPDRELVDRWTRDGTPYAVLRLTEGHALLGPFVVPGTTACLRCVDAHLSDVDPAWPLLVLQQAAACATTREDTLPEPCDPVLATLAAAWTARDVLTHLEGGSPSTASSTLRLGPELATLESQTWARHPACGCAWA